MIMKKVFTIIGGYIVLSYAVIGFGRTLYVINKKVNKKVKKVGVDNV